MARKPQNFFEVLNKSEETKTVDLLIYGAIPSFDEDTYKMKNSVDSFVREFKALEKDYDRINIRINSPGGSLYHAFPIFNAIRNSKKEIHTYNDGLAASAGGLLLMAGKKVHTAKNGILMIHNAQGFAMGSAENMRNVANTLDTFDSTIAKLIADRTGLTEAEVKEKYMNYKDHWMDADQAKAEGFIDEIDEYESEEMLPSNITEMAFGEVLNLYKEKEERSESFIDKIVNKVRAALAPNFIASEATQSPAQTASSPASTHSDANPANQQPQTDTMDFKNALDILNKENPSAEELAAVKNDILAFTGANEKFTAEEVNAKIDAAKTEISNELTQVKAEKTNLETEVKNLKDTVAAYKASGVTPSNTAGDQEDPIPGDEVENFLCETDIEARNFRKSAGLA